MVSLQSSKFKTDLGKYIRWYRKRCGRRNRSFQFLCGRIARKCNSLFGTVVSQHCLNQAGNQWKSKKERERERERWAGLKGHPGSLAQNGYWSREVRNAKYDYNLLQPSAVSFLSFLQSRIWKKVLPAMPCFFTGILLQKTLTTLLKIMFCLCSATERLPRHWDAY